MNEALVWQSINSDKTINFWYDLLKNKPLPPAIALERPLQTTVFRQENPALFLGKPVVRDSQYPTSEQDWGNLVLSTPDLTPTKVEGKNQSLFPYSAVGKLLFAFVVDGAYKIFEGSAFVLQTKHENAVFTAGHCLFSESHSQYPRQWAQHVVFIPFFELENRSLLDYFEAGDVYVANGMGVARHWYESGLDKRYEYDLGCITLERGASTMRDKTGALGWVAGDFELEQYAEARSVGYPVGPDFEHGGLWETGFEAAYIKFVGGFPHIRMKGNRFSQGASGGPVLVSSKANPNRFHVVGLNACLSDYGPEFVYWDAPRFGVEFLSMLDYLENDLR